MVRETVMRSGLMAFRKARLGGTVVPLTSVFIIACLTLDSLPLDVTKIQRLFCAV